MGFQSGLCVRGLESCVSDCSGIRVGATVGRSVVCVCPSDTGASYCTRPAPPRSVAVHQVCCFQTEPSHYVMSRHHALGASSTSFVTTRTQFRFRVSSVGVATHYGLHGLGFEPRRGQGVLCYLKRPNRPWGPPTV